MPSVAEMSHVGRWAKQAPASHSESAPANTPELSAVIAAAIDAGRQLSLRQTRLAPWCLWSGEHPLARRPDYLNKVLNVVAQSERPRPYRTLATAYVEAFAPDLPGLAHATQTLHQLSSRWPDEPWSLLHGKFAIFDPGQGPRRLADEVIKQDRPAPDILSASGVRAMAARGGYSRAVTAELLRKLSDGAEPDPYVRLASAQRYALDAGRLIFHDLSDLFAAALLKPFGRALPDKRLRDQILNALLAIFDDPRLPPSGRKHPLNPPYADTVKMWLTEQSLRQFLDVVEKTTENREQFAYRRAFWWAAYEQGFVLSAWVAFGRDGSALARRTFGANTPLAELYQEARQISRGHAVLLMEIGTGVIADWSHNGKCNIWLDRADPTAPRLFERSYGSNSIQIPAGGSNGTRDAISHVSPASYSWQRRVEQYLFEMTGRHLPSNSYLRR
jgi:hypothetical protein